MSKVHNIAVVNASSRLQQEAPRRALKLLRAISTSREIRGLLAPHGYTQKEHEAGWMLLVKVSGFTVDGLTGADLDPAGAIAELTTWVELNFRKARGALERFAAEQAAFVFDGLTIVRGVEAVVIATTFLDRLDALESAPERKSTRKADHAALAVLAERGIDDRERARVRHLLDLAQGEPPAAGDAETKAASHASDLQALRGWFADWSTTAHAVIARRDLLIRMGLAKRQSRKAAAVIAPQPPVIAPIASPPAIVWPVAPPSASAPSNPGNGASNGGAH